MRDLNWGGAELQTDIAPRRGRPWRQWVTQHTSVCSDMRMQDKTHTMGSRCKAERMGTQDRLRYEAVSLHGPRMLGARRAYSVSDV